MVAVRTPMIFCLKIQISVTRHTGVLCSAICAFTRRPHHDLTASLAFLLSLHGVRTATPRRPRCDYKTPLFFGKLHS